MPNVKIMSYIKFFFFILIINIAWSQDLDYLPHADRIVAMGDLHGDIYAFKRALRLGELIDENDDWIGGTTVFVQVGDQTDRGDFELEIINLIEKLTAQAKKAGGRVLALLGNHEIMNAELDFRFVTSMGFTKFSKFSSPISSRLTKLLPKISSGEKGRSIAFFPGGQISAILAKHNVAVVVGDTAFAHGGILPKWAKYGISKINLETREFLKGNTHILPEGIGSSDGLTWSRHFSLNTDAAACELLKESLQILGVKRMVVAHTVQLDGINHACDKMVWRVDVGMSNYYGGKAQALEIIEDKIKILK